MTITIHDIEKLPKFSEGRQFIWDKTSLEAAACLQRYKFKVLDRWQRPARPEGASFGIAAHNTFDFYDRAILGGDYDEALEAAIKYAIAKHGALLKNDSAQFNLLPLIRALVYYHEQFRAGDPLDFVVNYKNNEPVIEERFEVQLPGIEERLSGRIDKLVFYQGSVLILDRKFTKTTLSPRYFDSYNPDIQFLLYGWALNQMGFSVDGYIIEAHQVAASLHRCVRQSYELTPERMQDAVNYTVSAIKRANEARESGVWEKNFTQCNIYSGCDFRIVCNKGDNLAHRFLENMFEKGEPYNGSMEPAQVT